MYKCCNMMSLLRDIKFVSHDRIFLSRDKSVDLTVVLSFRATLFECLRHNHVRLRQVPMMWPHKPDPLLFIHSWDWRSVKQPCSRYIIKMFRLKFLKCSIFYERLYCTSFSFTGRENVFSEFNFCGYNWWNLWVRSDINRLISWNDRVILKKV